MTALLLLVPAIFTNDGTFLGFNEKSAYVETGMDGNSSTVNDPLLAERDMTLTKLAELADISTVNLSVLRNGRARAVRFSSLTAICRVLQCQPGDLLTLREVSAQRSRS